MRLSGFRRNDEVFLGALAHARRLGPGKIVLRSPKNFSTLRTPYSCVIYQTSSVIPAEAGIHFALDPCIPKIKMATRFARRSGQPSDVLRNALVRVAPE
jgi:hypothetical protein